MINKTSSELAEFLGIKENDLVSLVFLPHESLYDRKIFKVVKTLDEKNEPLFYLNNMTHLGIEKITILLNRPYEIIGGENDGR